MYELERDRMISGGCTYPKKREMNYTLDTAAIRRRFEQAIIGIRERATAIKRDHYTCQHCNRKQSRAQGRELSVAVHHLDGVDWDGLVDLIRDRLLQTPDRLQTLCSECHGAEHGEGE